MNKLSGTKKYMKDRWNRNDDFQTPDEPAIDDELDFDPVDQLLAERDVRADGQPMRGIDAEFMAFEAMPRVKKEDDRLDFWRKHKSQLPILFGIVQEILSVPCSSAKLERVFSSAGLVCSYFRSVLYSYLVHLNKLGYFGSNVS